LEPTTKIQAIYGRPFRLDYIVTLAGHQLSTNLHVHNPSTFEVLEYQALLHTYIKAPAYDVTITPLNGGYFYDKTEDTAERKLMAKLETRERVDVKVFTDSVYEDALQHYDVTWPRGGIQVRSHNMKDVVIWNPGNLGRDIVDLEDRGWSVNPLAIFNPTDPS
jgi:D-hexose-6-phosphate mutarotase